jgi:hypothetical protein
MCMCLAADGATVKGPFRYKDIDQQSVYLLPLVVTDIMKKSSHPCCCHVLFLSLTVNYGTLFHFHLVLVLSFAFHLFFFHPGSGLVPQPAMFVVIPAVFKAGLACFLEVFEGTVLVFVCRHALCNHVC